jgi:hypothetical protein
MSNITKLMLNAAAGVGGFYHGPGPDEASLDYDATTDTGYYGTVTSAELISGDSLASTIGLSAGTSQNSTAGWLKFYVGESAACNRLGYAYVLFVAKKNFRYDLSWNNIDAAKDVNGTDAAITIGGDDFKVRLLTGGDADPTTNGTYSSGCANNLGENSEWNDLLYRVHTDVMTCSDTTIGTSSGDENKHGGPQVGANWESFSDSDLNVGGYNPGTLSMCQEVYGLSGSGYEGTSRVQRGYYGIAGWTANNAVNTGYLYGWRPCLELVQP